MTMADNDQGTISALQSLTNQLQALNSFLDNQSQSLVGSITDAVNNVQDVVESANYSIVNATDKVQNIISTSSSGGFDLNSSAENIRAQMLGAIPLPSVVSDPEQNQNQDNLAPSNPQIVSENITQNSNLNNSGEASDLHTMTGIGQVLAAAQLGEAGGPQAYRTWRLGSYNWQQNLQVASNVANAGLNYNGEGDLGSSLNNLGAFVSNNIKYQQDENGNVVTDDNDRPIVSGFNNPTGVGPSTITPSQIQAGLQMASSAAKMVGSVDNYLGTQQTIGQTFGYGPGLGGNAVLGERNPTGDVSSAQRVGMGAEALNNALTGFNPSGPQDLGTGFQLTHSQSKDILDTLMNQGFQPGQATSPLATPTGDATTIAEGFMAPLMNQMPGLSASTLGQFTPALRNSGDSTQQLSDALSDLGTQAKTTKETVNELGDSLATAGTSFANMGSNLGNAYGTSQQFTEATGLDPQIAAQLAQNPILQGLALGQGVLPSGLGRMGGAFTSTALQAVQMLNSGLKGIDYNQYKTVNGQKFMTRNGRTQESDQIASLLGIPESSVQRMLNEGNRYKNVASAESLVGNSNNPLGIYANYEADTANGHKITGSEREQLQSQWGAITPTLRQAGISKKEISALDSDKNWRDRLKRVNNDLSKQGGGGTSNQINGGSTSVTIDLSPQAAKLFNIQGPSNAKKTSNAGGTSINVVTNSIEGDLSQGALTLGSWLGGSL